MRVQVYRNLHKNCYSVRCKKTRKVIAHVNYIQLVNVEFKVSESGRRRVLREKRKNVHAVVEGDTILNGMENIEGIRVKYNPYFVDCFYTEDGPIFKADRVVMNEQFKIIAQRSKNG